MLNRKFVSRAAAPCTGSAISNSGDLHLGGSVFANKGTAAKTECIIKMDWRAQISQIPIRLV